MRLPHCAVWLMVIRIYNNETVILNEVCIPSAATICETFQCINLVLAVQIKVW